MTVTTDYRVKTTEDVLSASTADEWKRLAAECGLSALLEKREAGEVDIGWTKLDNQTGNALRWLCPQSCELAEYRYDVPPIEALGLISFAQMTGSFDKIMIHYNDRLPDPVAIGTKGNSKYLICAWGPDEIPVERWVEKFRTEIAKGFEAYKARLCSGVMATTLDWLRNGWSSGPVDLQEMR